MVYQNDVRLPEKIRKYGCNFRSLLAMAEFYDSRELTVDEIIEAYDALVGKAMDADCTMNSHLSLAIEWSFKKLGYQYHGSQVGIVYPPARFEFWKSARVFTVLKGLLHQKGYEGRSYPTFHFRLGDRMGKLLFDPHSPPLKVISEDCVLIYQVSD